MIVYGIECIILGLLAVPSLVLAKKPNAKELFDKVAPYQGWIGVVFCFAGLWTIISAVLNLGYISSYPVSWALWLASGVVQAALGFIMGFALIEKYILSKNPEAQAKGKEILAKLMPLQGKIGIAAIIIGIVYVVCSILSI